MVDVFYNIDLQNGLNIISAATGIGESLLCIIISVCVVLLSMLIHWWFNGQLRNISDKVDSFIVDVINIFARNLDGLAVVAPTSTTNDEITHPDTIYKNTNINSEKNEVKNRINKEENTTSAERAKKATPVDDDV